MFLSFTSGLNENQQKGCKGHGEKKPVMEVVSFFGENNNRRYGRDELTYNY